VGWIIGNYAQRYIQQEEWGALISPKSLDIDRI
jgi:hypothetical protein